MLDTTACLSPFMANLSTLAFLKTFFITCHLQKIPWLFVLLHPQCQVTGPLLQDTKITGKISLDGSTLRAKTIMYTALDP